MDQPVKQWLTRRKRGEDENTQTWISRERKELLDEKAFFVVFKGLSFGEK